MCLPTLALGVFLLGQAPADLTDVGLGEPITSNIDMDVTSPESIAPAPTTPEIPALNHAATDLPDAAPSEVVVIAPPVAASRPLDPGAADPGAADLGTADLGAVEPAPRLRPREMLIEALHLPAEGTVQGRRITLVEALGASLDRAEQMRVTQAYWRLVEAVALYGFAAEYEAQVFESVPFQGEEALLRAAKAAAVAMLRDSEASVVAAQHDLAQAASLPPSGLLPLPADLPLTGMYGTRYDELFANRPAPIDIALLARTLPLRQQAVESQAMAVTAAAREWSLAVNAYGLRRQGLAATLAAARRYRQRRQAFVRTVCRYNHDIANYALAVVGPGIGGQTVATMLIEPSNAFESGVEPAAHYETVPRSKETVPGSKEEPIREAVSPTRSRSAVDGGIAPFAPRDRQPEPVPSREEQWRFSEQPPREIPTPAEQPVEMPANQGGGLPAVDEPARDNESELPTLQDIEQPGIFETPAANHREEPATNSRPMVSVEPDTPNTTESIARKPIVDALTVAADASSLAVYPALVDVTPIRRARQLASTMHWDVLLPDDMGEAITLDDYLSKIGGASRQDSIRAYWETRQKAAEYQVHTQQLQWLDTLLAIETDATTIARLQSTHAATEATCLETHVELLELQSQLATRIGIGTDAPWPLPSTAPHGGSYLLKLEDQPETLRQQWEFRRAASAVPTLGESVWDYARAVVEADIARAGAMASFQAGSLDPDILLETIGGQTRQSLAFLETLTEYNAAIAEYVLVVAPPGTPTKRLSRTLVLNPE